MIITAKNNYEEFDQWLEGKKKILLVCDDAIRFLENFNEKLSEINIPIIRFSDFQPNPLYESVVKGIQVFRKEECDSIIAVGGGSAIDVAKCIKLYWNMSGEGEEGSYLKQKNISNNTPFLAMPTTAGTGSEATRYAVIYYRGIKQSITSESIIPETVLMDSNVLKTLPLYQKKATMMDALCHAIESFWSVNSTEESKRYSRKAIRSIITNMDGYLANTKEGNMEMLIAAYRAGKAINITQTTAGHAMCYKITSLFGLAHGHAAILCNRILYSWMIMNIEKCIDPRGKDYMRKTLDEIGQAMGGENAKEGAERLLKIFKKLELEVPRASTGQYRELKMSVNPVRLKNHPIVLDLDTIDLLYHDILR